VNNQISAHTDREEEVIYGTYKGNLVMENLIIGGVITRPTALGKLFAEIIEPANK
jgi:hypothetical protein